MSTLQSQHGKVQIVKQPVAVSSEYSEPAVCFSLRQHLSNPITGETLRHPHEQCNRPT